ncbi:hypothetical protein DBV05_g7532 [Lasiodiplodia theobromae]|uniref:Heterokaryon incompatibility domain-containing protein n=1 Tax=Lasiodiplodia theobromae TaxID=45133 RepID=A0A5N5D7S7_9PEZI|nr:hypothetical protein DBV05_g7532 [Lasiodiplodia theobromae]
MAFQKDFPQKGGQPLCEVCSTIDFKSIAHPTRLCTKTRDAEPSGYRTLLGTVSDISDRSSRCAFCNLVWRRLQTNCSSSSNLDGRCYLYDQNLCISAFDQRGSGPDPQNLQQGLHAHVRIASVQFNPETHFNGPALPWQIGSFLEQGGRDIVHLQQVMPGPCSQTGESGGATEDNAVEKEVLESVRVRRVAPEVDMSLISSWLRRCESTHEDRCAHALSSAGHGHARVMPAFVIDVKKCCVVETPSDCRYVALSYVWGAAKTLKHVKANSDALRTRESLSTPEVPGTIRDAIRLVHGTGERYLWVDALCIVQDDVRMQQTQIAQMHEIYAGAVFTIVAADGSNADSGLPGVHPNVRAQAQELISLPGCDLATILSDLDTGEGGSKIAKSIWIQRAWTMQEMLFSRRCLIFTDDHVYWRCRAAVWLEEISLESLPVTDLRILPGNADFQLPAQPLQSQEYFDIYKRLLINYRQRRLSYASDLVNAFSGLTSSLSIVQKDSFFWGHPCTQFSRSLGWKFWGYHTRNDACTNVMLRDGSVRKVPFPSWSWAAWEGKNNLPWISFTDYPGYGADSKVSEVFEPITDFWISNEDGELVRIEDHGSGVPQSEDHAQQLLWQGAEREIPPNDLDRQPGHLHFWSSVATFPGWDGHLEGSTVASLSEPDQSSFYTSECRRAENVASMEHGLPPRNRIEDGEIREARDYDLVVVCRITRTGQPPKLSLVAVEWKNGVAYRLRSEEVTEKQWIGFKHREWKLVTLG